VLRSDITKENYLFRKMFEYSLTGAVVLSMDGRWVTVNDTLCQLTGYSKEELLRFQFEDVMYAEDLQRCEECLKQLYRHRDKVAKTEVNTRFIHRLGHDLWASLHISLLHDEQGKPLYFLIQVQDQTETRKAEEFLQTSEKLNAVGTMAAGIAHEIRNPLTSLKGFLQLIKANPNAKYQYFKIMEDELNRIELILSELLVLSKPEKSKVELINFSLLMEQVTTILQPHMNLYNIELITEVEEGQFLQGDVAQLKQVFINLLKNAIEAMPDGGQLCIHSASRGDRIQVRIRDEGVGMDADQLDKIGQPFYTTKEKGTGLGLMVSYRIVKNHGGSVSVDSKEQEGTTFSIEFPKANIRN
jgi:PAS domain S-box-containing protein